MLHVRSSAPILGAYAFETSAYSKLTDWPGGGVVGVHGTPWPWLLGQAVSHGCVHLPNDDVRFLRSRVPVRTPVKIVRRNCKPAAMRAKTQPAEPRASFSAPHGATGRDEDEARTARGSRRPTLAVVATVIAAFTTYAALALVVDSPRVFSDELLYFDTAASIVEGDGLTIRGEAYHYAPLYPALLAAVHWIAPDREAAYELAKALNALLFALTAIPVFLLARRVLPPWPSAAAAALSVAIPSAVYVSVVMTECLAYLACSWALYAIVLALERPSVPRQFAAMVAILLATGVRTQFLVLYGVYLLGFVLVPLLTPARRPRTRSALVSFWPTAVALALGLAALARAWILGTSDGTVGAYSVLFRTYDIAEVAEWFVYQLANLDLYLAVIPFAVAPIVLAAGVTRARQGSERHAAFVTLFLGANAALLLLTAAFNTTAYAGDRLHDRPVFYIVPLWLIVLFAWVVEGAPRPLLAAGVGAALALVLPILLPFSEYARDDAPQQFNAVATTLWASIDRSVAEVGASGFGILVLVTLLLVLATLLVSVRRARLLPAVVVAVFAVTSELNWDLAARVSAPWAAVVPSEERFWLDERVPHGRSVTLLAAVESCPGLLARDSFYGSEFFNSSVRRAAYVGTPPDSLPSARVSVSPAGRLVIPSGAPLVADYILAQPTVRFEGRRVAAGTAARLTLWEIGGAVRALGVDSTAEFEAAACRRSQP